MRNIVTELGTSLVGVHISYKVKGEEQTLPIESTIAKIDKDLSKARSGGRYGIFVLIEMYAFYRNEPYFHSIRRALNFGRLNKEVMGELETPLSQRVKEYILLLQNKHLTKKFSPERELLLKAIYYVCQNVPKYTKIFKPFLSKEEYFNVV